MEQKMDEMYPNAEQEREAFEEWATGGWAALTPLPRWGFGYESASTHEAWRAWLARSAVTTIPAPGSS